MGVHAPRIVVCLAAVLMTVPFAVPAREQGPVVAVLAFELKDLTLQPNNPEERRRTASLKPLLEQSLAAAGYRIAEVAAENQRAADSGFGYLFEHHDVAARLGRQAGADWVIVGRVHKASFLFVYFKARVVNARTGRLGADLIVEVKGPQAKLTRAGVRRLAQQIDGAIEKHRAEAAGPRLFGHRSGG